MGADGYNSIVIVLLLQVIASCWTPILMEFGPNIFLTDCHTCGIALSVFVSFIIRSLLLEFVSYSVLIFLLFILPPIFLYRIGLGTDWSLDLQLCGSGQGTEWFLDFLLEDWSKDRVVPRIWFSRDSNFAKKLFLDNVLPKNTFPH